MNFLKTLDQALDFERLEKTVTEKVQQAALSVVEEFPDRNRAAPTGALLSITPAVLVEAREVSEIWQAYEMERRKDDWEAACAELKVLLSKDETAHVAWQRRAQDAEHKLYQLYNSLLALPDPAPFLYLLTTLAARVQELEDANRKLQAAADQAAKDDAEVGSLIEKHQKLLESTKELQEELARRDARISEMSAAASEAAAARQEMSLQAAEMARLQRSLRAVREEYEATQQSLFELQSRMESLAGSRQQEAELASEELDRVTKRAAELEMERQQLICRLENAQRQVAVAAAGAAPAAAGGLGVDAALPAAAAGSGGSVGASTTPGSGGAGGAGGGLLGGDYVLLERQLAVREEQVSALSSSLEAVQRGAADAASRHALELATLRDQLSTTRLALDRLEREVARRPDPTEYQELRRRAEALQSLVDVQMQAEGWSGEQVEATLRDLNAQTVTSVLQERSRKLSSEVSSLKRQMAERDKQPATSSLLLPQLSGSLGVLVTSPSGVDLTGAAAAADEGGGDGDGGGGLDGGGGGGGGGSLSDIVVSQLSDELHKTRQQLQSSRNDNVALFEKIRYLERYNQRAAAASRTTVVRVDAAGVAQPSPEELAAVRGSRYQCGPFALEVGAQRGGGGGGAATVAGAGGGAGGIGGGGSTRYSGGAGMRSRGARRGGGPLACFGDGDDVESCGVSSPAESRAARAYEARVNPFAEFQQSEVDSRMRNLQVHDRALLVGSRLLLGSRVARMFLAIYTVMLHFIILLLFFYATTPCPAQGGGAGGGEQQQQQQLATAATLAAAAGGGGGGVVAAAAAAVLR
ncbi:hypothetical protein VOLCADRAFT_117799 [Volvox carteri f. nagariensis]|uniref:CASP C-terminal domain-containing protein n=1 Tax=Volvox carteri f. nagariensis TaxID=3068 RepID=D8TXT6_VOLCA|nr:uncharacterized protein VOLCADRAFT_117799 [Volvox carteri f. nagariensis]EFJ47697.1 hypothetical protein VOLCADRAFT_117799 [Volvox carteri f. nagariensis]|eukprot:XP_002951168.1 hypothetical protein VOLCADRAFT_117799 [Volvox carteri f. nagariensis]